MHIKSLKVFCDVVARRSFSRAADANGISQSGASQIVQQLARSRIELPEPTEAGGEALAEFLR